MFLTESKAAENLHRQEEFGIGLDDVAIANVEKLKRRYPEGFSEDASRNRHEAQSGGGALVDVPRGVRNGVTYTWHGTWEG